MTLWVFGDSFSLTTNNPHPDQWMHRLGKELDTPVKCFGLHGSSLEFTYYRFNISRNEIQENDVVVVNLTRSDRRWFFKNYPTIHGYVAPDNDPNSLEAIQQYHQLLDKNQDVPNTYLLNFLNNLHYLTKRLNLKTVILSNANEEHNLMIEKQSQFPLFSIAKGMLRDLSINEYKKEFQYLLTETKIAGAFDPRMNHLIKSNHVILAYKILSNIKNKTPINLTEGVMKNVVTKELLEDESFIIEELFDSWTQSLYSLNLNNPAEVNEIFK